MTYLMQTEPAVEPLADALAIAKQTSISYYSQRLQEKGHPEIHVEALSTEIARLKNATMRTNDACLRYVEKLSFNDTFDVKAIAANLSKWVPHGLSDDNAGIMANVLDKPYVHDALQSTFNQIISVSDRLSTPDIRELPGTLPITDVEEKAFNNYFDAHLNMLRAAQYHCRNIPLPVRSPLAR